MIQEKIDKHLLAQEEIKKNKIRSGKFSPSSLGRCYRMQYWNRLNEPKSNPLKAETLRIFAIGNLIHKFFQDILKENCLIEAKVETEDCLGFADIVGENEVVDIKSVRSFQFKLMKGIKDKKNHYKKIPYDFPKEKSCEILQVSYYAITLGKPKGRLIFVNKDSLEVVEYSFEVKNFEDRLKKELEVLRGYWVRKELPPPEPRVYNGKECEYCQYQTKCKGI